MLLDPQEDYNEAIIGVYSTPRGGVAVYDYQYLVDAEYQSYKDESKNSSKSNDKEIREEAEEYINFNTLRAVQGLYEHRGPIIVRRAYKEELDEMDNYLIIKGQRYLVLASGRHFKSQDEDEKGTHHRTLKKPAKNNAGICVGTCLLEEEDDKDEETREKPKEPAKKQSKESPRHLSVPIDQADLSFMTKDGRKYVKNPNQRDLLPCPSGGRQ